MCPGRPCGVNVMLDNGIMGFIPIQCISDKGCNNPEERVFKGQHIHVRVTAIDCERLSIRATSKTSDLVDKEGNWK